MNEVLNGDCLELIKAVADDSVDLVLTDPPYGDNEGYGRNGKEILNNEDESINYRILPELYRVLKEGGVCYLFTNWKFTGAIQEWVKINTKFTCRMQLVIVKNNFGMGYGFRNQYELCLVFEKGKVEYERADVSNVLKMEHIHHDDKSHPHEKGIQLLELLIDHASKRGDLVLDCFAGSGSTLIAAKNTGRNYLGFELDPKYFKYASERIASSTTSMF